MNPIIRLLKQLTLEKSSIIFLVSMTFFTLNMISQGIETFQNPSFYNGLWIAIYFFLGFVSLILAFILGFHPYREKITDSITLKNDTTIELPRLYAFSRVSAFDLVVPYEKCPEDLLKDPHELSIGEEAHRIAFLDPDKFDIKLLDKNNKEIEIKKSSFISKNHVLSIRLENKKDIKKATKIVIKSEHEFEFHVEYFSYNIKK